MDSSPKEAIVSEWSLVGTLSQGQWSRDHKEDSEVRIVFPPSPQGAPVHPASGQLWSGGPGDMWGHVSCCPPEPSLWPPMAGPRPWGGSAPLHASDTSWQHHLPGMPSAGPASTPSTTWSAWGAWGPVGLGARLLQQWWLSRVWGPGTDGAASWALISARTGPWSHASGPALSCQNRDQHSWDIYGNSYLTMIWPSEQGLWYQDV